MHIPHIVNGTAVAGMVYERVTALLEECLKKPTLAIITCDPQGPSQTYVALKERRAVKLGINVQRFEVPGSATTQELIATVNAAVVESSGVIVQLPLPAQIDTDAVLAAIPKSHDVDAMSYDGKGDVMPPVVGAIAAIAQYYQFDFTSKHIVLVGLGRLVGKPFLTYTQTHALDVQVITEATERPTALLRQADVIVTGVGKPGLIGVDEVAEGVAIFDAGTSEQGGALVGDVAPEVALKTRLFTPVPGGIGPVTMAILFLNCVLLHLSRE